MSIFSCPIDNKYKVSYLCCIKVNSECFLAVPYSLINIKEPKIHACMSKRQSVCVELSEPAEKIAGDDIGSEGKSTQPEPFSQMSGDFFVVAKAGESSRCASL